MNVYLVYVTTKDEAEARRIASAVIEERLAACANILGAMQSMYWWDGAVCSDDEVALLLKTSEERKAELIARIRELHSYDVPCVVCLPVADGNPAFLQWVADETAAKV